MRGNSSNRVDQLINALAVSVAFGVAAHLELDWGWSVSLLAGLAAFDVTAILIGASRYATRR